MCHPVLILPQLTHNSYCIAKFRTVLCSAYDLQSCCPIELGIPDYIHIRGTVHFKAHALQTILMVKLFVQVSRVVPYIIHFS